MRWKVLVLMACIFSWLVSSCNSVGAIGWNERKCVVLYMSKHVPKQERITAFYKGKIYCSKNNNKSKTRKEWREKKGDKIGGTTLKQFYRKFKDKEKKYKNMLLNRCVVIELSDIYQSSGAEVGKSAKDKAITDCFKMAYDDESFLTIQQTWIERRDEKSATTGNTLRNDYRTIEKYYK